METIGERLRRLRATQNITAQQLADQVGVTRAHITQIENNRKGLSMELIQALEGATGVSADWLLFGKGEMCPRDSAPASASAQDFEEFTRWLAGRHPDIVLHLRSIVRNRDALTEKDRQALMDLISIAMGQAHESIRRRVKDGPEDL